MPGFSVIIVSWNALGHLKTFLPSVVQADYPDFEVLLADNASSDGSAEWVGEHFPEVKVIALDKNYGYCGGNNRGAKHARGDILVFLNNDVKVEPDWLSRLEDCFHSHPYTAIQPKMLSYEQPGQFEYAGAAGGFLDKYGYPFCRGRLFDFIEQDHGQYNDQAPVLWASGAALAIRREYFFELSGFDEDFEFHMEEIDLCWQLWNRGYKVGFCADSVVYHLGGGSLPMGSPRKVYYNYRNNLVMLLKNYSTLSLWTRLPVRIFMDIVSALRMLLNGDRNDFIAVLKAHFHFLLRIPATVKKRKRLQRERKIPYNPPTMLPVNIAWNYFLKGVNTYIELEDHGWRRPE